MSTYLLATDLEEGDEITFRTLSEILEHIPLDTKDEEDTLDWLYKGTRYLEQPESTYKVIKKEDNVIYLDPNPFDSGFNDLLLAETVEQAKEIQGYIDLVPWEILFKKLQKQ